VREAPGKGNGVFAARPIGRGETIFPPFDGPVVDRAGLVRLRAWEREHLSEFGVGLWRVLPEPRCYLNHACDPNALGTERDAVIALRAIAAEEEITIDYRLNAYDDGTGVWVMDCACDPARGPHTVVGEFFSLPLETQQRYLEWAPAFIRDMYAERQRTK
jgi:hypothetical protein